MITDEQFKKHISDISDQYEQFKDAIYKHVYFLSPEANDLMGRLTKLRDTACIALREAHTTKNPNLN